MEIITISEESKKCLEALDPQYKTVSEMAESEREFLTELILRYKPKKVLEVGIAAGSSSVGMLNALKSNQESFEFHSVDYSKQYYKDREKKTGFIIDQYPELAKHRKLYAGGYVSNYLEEIGDNIDFCLIDTVHSLPGEILDFLMILPYLREDAIVVFHDTNLHTREKHPHAYVNNLLVSAISGKKLLPETYNKVFSKLDNDKFNNDCFPNITAIHLNGSQKENSWDIFNLLTQHWLYSPKQGELTQLTSFVKRHYGEELANFFAKIITHQRLRLNKAIQGAKEQTSSTEITESKKNLNKLHDIVIRAEKMSSPVSGVATMLSSQEQNLLYLIAKEYFTGEGAIFDGGCCNGGCVQSFAKGLHDTNAPVKNTIYAYEWGQVTSKYLQDFFKKNHGIDYNIGDSFIELTKGNLENCIGSQYIKFLPGDILEQEYPEKIEIFFLDVCKAPDVNHAMIQLLERCIPEKTLIIQQDYKWYGTPWLNISMGYLKDYLYTFECNIPNTQVFLLKKAIPKEILQKETWKETSLEEKLRYFNCFQNFIAMKYRLALESNKTLLYKHHGLADEAKTLLDYIATYKSLLSQKGSVYFPKLNLDSLNSKDTLFSYVQKEILAKNVEEPTQQLPNSRIKTSAFHALKNWIFQLPLKKKAFTLCNTGQIYEAEGIALNIVKNTPYISWGYYILGKAYWQQGKKKLAIENIEKAIEIDPHITYYRTYLASIFRTKKNSI